MATTEYIDCITFTGESSDFTLAVGSKGAKEWDGTVEYSTDHNTWTTWDGSAVSSVDKKLYLRGSGNTTFNTSKGARLSLSARAACSGNIQTLLEYSNPPAAVASNCYNSMFYGCTNLTSAPELPATTLANACYNFMFYGCTSLTSAPELPATTLKNYCYQFMFYGCTSLTSAPELPATTLANACYAYMFYGCTSLRISSTQSSEYPTAWRIPSSGTISSQPTDWNYGMLVNTGGTFRGNPSINKTYYGAWTSQETDTSKKFTKLKYKASNFCQLLDKSKYPATREIAGITFTNNGDGSFTMTGTKTGNAQLEICVADVKKGHKYLGTTGTDIFYMWFFKSDGSSIYGDFYSSPFYTAPETDTDIRFFIKTDSTDEVNVTAYPQLFDLTEMYGAGNEPTTLAEFRQKYPNDLYPYSPQCWYSINKTRYITPTKNLFDINNGFIRQVRCNGVIENGVATITATAANASYCFAKVDVEVGKTYIVSANWITTGYSLGLMVSNESSYDTASYGYITETTSSIKIVANGTELYLKGYVTYEKLPAVATISNIQVEENSVKTDYVPHGYLPINKGVKV